ncbi:hypothetical protein LCGC14_3154070 [marine sediment metagenome]|uniref:Uncharacterized protein n=1 Tax=marine sediment metagenome TaxID=412755 RepID=A0A0F8VTA4_9ZZZZ
MPDMTVKEAASILSGVVHNLRAAKRLESALKVVEGLDGLAEEAENKKEKVSTELDRKNLDLEVVTGEIEREEARRETALAETGRLKTEAQADLQRVNSEVEAKVAEANSGFTQRVEELETAFKLKVLDLDRDTKDREGRLRVVTDKLEEAKTDLAAVKERLG